MKDVRTSTADTITIRGIIVRTAVMYTSCEVKMHVYLAYKYQFNIQLIYNKYLIDVNIRKEHICDCLLLTTRDQNSVRSLPIVKW
jgi:hypothetical protein